MRDIDKVDSITDKNLITDIQTPIPVDIMSIITALWLNFPGNSNGQGPHMCIIEHKSSGHFTG